LTCDEVGCGKHAECERYLAYDAERQAVRQARHREDLVDGYVVTEVFKAKRSSRRYRERKKI
jgi:hypothetical protein